MAASFHDSNAQKGDAIQELLKSGSGLTAVKPKVNDVSIIRFIPEQAADGTPLPMVVGQDANGPLFSNLAMEPLVLFAGSMTKFHGLVRPSDPGLRDMDDPDLPFAGLYIKLKGDMNKNRVPQDQYMLVNELLKKPKGGSAQLAQVQDHVLGQCCVIQINGKACNPPDTKRVVVLGKSAKLALAACLRQAYENGIDVFDPKTGFALKIYGSPKIGDTPQNFIIEPAYPLELPESAWKNQWVPWDAALKRYTYDELIGKMVAAYGAGVVAMKPSYKEAMDRLGIRSGTASYAAPAAPSHHSAPAPAAPAASGWGPAAPAQPAADYSPPKPAAPAGGGWPVASAAAPAAPATTTWGSPAATPAPVQNAWGKPAQAAPIPMPNVQAPAVSAPVPDISALEAAYNAEIAKTKGTTK